MSFIVYLSFAALLDLNLLRMFAYTPKSMFYVSWCLKYLGDETKFVEDTDIWIQWVMFYLERC